MTVKESIVSTEEAFRSAGIIPWQFEARQLVSHILGVSPAELRLGLDKAVDQNDLARLNSAVERRLNGEPLQYIMGWWEFYSLPFKVGPGVLIPRADTELLVDYALEYLKGRPSAKVADLCSGSGCIAIAVAKQRPDCNVSAFELSKDALEYLKFNNEYNCAGVNIIPCDITADFCADKFDIILSNPPYIETDVIDELDAEVKNEPHMALDGGNDGLDFYRCITEKWVKNLKPGGALMVEVGINQHVAVAELFRHAGLENIGWKADLNGIERVIVGTLPL